MRSTQVLGESNRRFMKGIFRAAYPPQVVKPIVERVEPG